MDTITDREYIDATLSELESDAAGLLALVDEWGGLDESAKATYSLEWYYSMIDTLPDLDRMYRAGGFSDKQSVRYHALLAKLGELAPTIERLGLQQPTVVLIPKRKKGEAA